MLKKGYIVIIFISLFVSGLSNPFDTDDEDGDSLNSQSHHHHNNHR